MRFAVPALIVAGLAVGAVAEWSSLLPESPGLAAGDFAAGLAFVALGALTVRRSPVTGALMVATGLAWFLGGFAGALVFLHRGPLVHLLLSYPNGRLETRFERRVVAAAYLCAAVYPLGRSSFVTLALLGTVAASAVTRYMRAGGAARRARAWGLAAGAAPGAVLAVAAALRLAGVEADRAVLWAYELALLLAACVLFAGLRWGRWTQAALTGVMVDLGELGHEATLRARLARSVGDPSLQLGLWHHSRAGYVDESGRTLPTEQAPGQSRLLVADPDGAPLAAIVHDSAVLADPRLGDAVSAAVRIAAVNMELQAQVEAKVEELRASRHRLVEAADAERRRLERDLRAAAEPRLRRLETLLRGGGPELRALREELERVEDELAELARGIHPHTLTERGLASALEELAERFPIAVEVDAVSASELPPPVAAAAYFVCSEGLANVAKHARATQVRLAARALGGTLVVEVVDDGAGGADIGAGAGLRGIADRVDVLGGRLAVDSPIGTGTTLAATIPLAAGLEVHTPIEVAAAR